MRFSPCLSLLGLALFCWPAIQTRAAEEDDKPIREAVVKISATKRNPDVLHPWRKQSPQEVGGSGVVIEGKRILTNAHVVLYASQVMVQPSQSDEKIAATVEAIGPGIDLAVLKLEDEAFFETHRPLARATTLPAVKDSVLVYGFPQGGSSLSITKGIVSRIEFGSFYATTSGARIQIDAAINPGNSGGPALVDGKMIGLIFSRLREADNIGYIIPSEEINLFLADVTDGKYDGKPALRDHLQTLENDALRAKLGLDRKASGMVVHEPDKTDASYPLKKWDLITKIGDHEVDNTGMAAVRDDLRMAFQYFVQQLAKDGKLPLTIVRDGHEIEIQLPVKNKGDELVQDLEGKYPPYFFYGPLVFTSVNAELMGGLDRLGNNFAAMMAQISSPLATRRGAHRRAPDEELVVIPAPMFPHKIAKGYSNPVTKVIKEVNGVRIRNLKHLVETFRDSKDKFITIVFDDHSSETIVFNRQEMAAATDEVLNDNGVRQQCSDDLVSVWERKP